MSPPGNRRVAVLTGGGDAPGLNAVVRAVAKSAFGRGWEVLGIEVAPGILARRFRPRAPHTVPMRDGCSGVWSVG